MSSDFAKGLTMVERVERAMVVLAYCIELDGDVHLPLYEKFEEELRELKKRDEVRERARRLLAAYTEAGGFKAIR